jgi:teichuronic acid biosynthesis glycosyltransferase TuaH
MTSARAGRSAVATGIGESAAPFAELVLCSLEPWDAVWRRNQFLADALLDRRADLRVLFVEPAADVLFDLTQLRRPLAPRVRLLRGDRRLRTLRPLKVLPRRFGSLSDRLLLRQVIAAARLFRFTQPMLWVNDLTYAPLMRDTGWPSVYDVTDDWLLLPDQPREAARLRALEDVALEYASEVVVCSPGLEASRGRTRTVTLIRNGVDVTHFRHPRERPWDLPVAPVAVYVGTLHDARLDVDLVVELARSLPTLSIVLVGPDSLSRPSRRRLTSEPNVHLLGPRSYADVPAYLQHANLVVVPHCVSPFTDSLDPIKAYECLAVGTPTVATPVAGFAGLTGSVVVAPPAGFVAAVRAALRSSLRYVGESDLVGWTERAEAFETVLERARERKLRAAAY